MKTLDLINQARESFALEPLTELPTGVRFSGDYCPVALALKEIDPDAKVYKAHASFDTNATAKEVGRVWATKATGLGGVLLPPAIKQFVSKFDNGHYSKYEEE